MNTTKKNDSTTIKGDKNKSTPNRPTGEDVARYKKMDKWTYKKWAWEFLRRNPDYIADCKKVVSAFDDEKDAIARKYGLKKFKYNREGYREGVGRPKFDRGSMGFIPNLNEDATITRKINIAPGKVLVQFDLVTAFCDKKALNKQIRRTENMLDIYKKQLPAKLIEQINVQKPKVMNFGIYIRLLDALAANKTTEECADLIFPNEKYEKPSFKNKKVRDKIKSAKSYALDKYRYLSIFQGKPNCKAIRLTQ